MQNLNINNYVWAIYVGGVIKRTKVKIDYNDYTVVDINKDYKLLYKTLAYMDCNKNKFFDNDNDNIHGTAYIINKNGNVENNKTPKKTITEILNSSPRKNFGEKPLKNNKDVNKNTLKFF